MFTPSLEITTVKVCPIDCYPICPQRKFRQIYGNQKEVLSYEDFSKVIETVPKEVWIAFSGFSEPFLNQNVLDMMELARKKGHKISVFTTLIGLKLEDVDRFIKVKPEVLTLHLSDSKGIAHIPQTDDYREVLRRVEWLATDRMTLDASYINDRAGNCEGSKPRHIYGELKCFKLNKPNFVMLPNGDVYLCCMDWSLEHKLGNLLKDSWDDLVGGVYKSIVAESKERDGMSLCRRCWRPNW